MKIIPFFDYAVSKAPDSVSILHDLADSSTGAIVCRVRQSKDGVLFVCQDPTLARLCLCDERVSDLRFAEIRAMMRLCNRRVLTFDELLSSYNRSTPLVFHFRGFRPEASVVSRVVRDARFSFGTDSAEQLGVISMGFPHHRTVGFASHLAAAEVMMSAGASVLCLYGREPAAYTPAQISPLSEKCEVWIEIPDYATENLDDAIRSAFGVFASGVVLPVDRIQ